jgi:glucan phosphoethanolaminetransferase (alkaline phosphatase superfamily)
LHGSQVAKVPYHAHREGGEEVHVLVLGESARRESWSVYGYGRPTTPYLDKLKGEAVFLQNAVADANLTSWAVPILLSGVAPETFMHTPIRGNIVDLAKEAGYSTAWLLNQDITISLEVGIDADRTIYPPDFKANILDRHTLDESLLPAYGRELERTGRARFIGIHMMGSHWEYYRRYPQSFAKFGSGAGLSMISIFTEGEKVESMVTDSYDNTVLYTDWFLQQIIEPVRRLRVPATVTFFPDHGEDLQKLDGESGHGAPKYTRHAFEIPAFVWMNEAYVEAHPEKVAALRANAAKEVRSHDLFGTLAELLGIRWPGQDPTRSFASERFSPDTSAKLIAGGKLITRP